MSFKTIKKILAIVSLNFTNKIEMYSVFIITRIVRHNNAATRDIAQPTHVARHRAGAHEEESPCDSKLVELSFSFHVSNSVFLINKVIMKSI